MARQLTDVGVILLDSDDLLTKTYATKWAMYTELGRLIGVVVTEEMLHVHWGNPIPVLMAGLYGSDAEVQAQVAMHRLEIEPQYPVTAQPDALKVLGRLREAGIPLGVLSSTDLPRLLPALEQAGISVGNFRIGAALAIQGGEATDVHKPDGRVFEPMLQLIREQGITGPVTYVGDDRKDWLAADDAGIGFVGITTGLTSREEFAALGAPLVFESLTAALPALLAGV